MFSHKKEHHEEDIKRELTAILRELKDPRVANSMISIVRTEISKDLSSCKVYISSIYGNERSKKALIGLKSAEGYIKRELLKRLKLRQSPSIAFFVTDSIEYSANISKILNNLKDENSNDFS